MKSLISILLLCAAFSSSSIFAQCSGRYYDKIFPEPDVFTTILGVPVPDFLSKLPPYEVPYGSAEGQTLNMYIFQPEGDILSKRPLVMLAFGGSFTSGVKYSPDIIKLCAEFTARGFVTASIDYRLNSGTVDSATMLKQVIKAVQDAKAAIRYFYKDAATDNNYRVDTNKIFMGGTSAGALIGVHLGYVTDTANLQQWMKEIIASQGELEGTSGNPGYSSRIAGVIDLAGAIGDTAWIEPGEIPMVSMQGDQDGTVPYCSDIISVSGNPLLVVDGCGTIKSRTAHLGIRNAFYTWRNAGHVPYVDPRPTTEGPAYMDTTIWFIRDFLFEQMTGTRCNQWLADAGRVTNPCGAEIHDPTDSISTTGITHLVLNENFSVYPNPSADIIYVEKESGFSGSADVQVYDNIGRLVKSYRNMSGKLALNKRDFGTGLFIVKIIPENKNLGIARAKVVFQ